MSHARKDEIVKYIAENEGCSSSQLQQGIKFFAPSFYTYMKALQEEGRIHRRGNTSGTTWFTGADDNENRNIIVMRLRCIVTDIRRTASNLEKHDYPKACELRIYADVMQRMAENLLEGP